MSISKSLPVSLDTVHIYWNNIEPDFDFTGWRYTPPKEQGGDYCFVFQHEAIGDLKLTYWVYSGRLIMQIPSISGLANGSNHIPYKPSQFDLVEEKIQFALVLGIQNDLQLEEAIISRADFYKTLEFYNQKDCDTFMNWYDKHDAVGHTKRKDYGNETKYHTLKSGLKVRAYQKHKQMPAVDMPPAVRIECEWRDKFNLYIRPYSAKDLLTNPLIWDKFYNMAMDKMKLAGKVLTLSEFQKEIDRILKIEYPKAKKRTIGKYKRILIFAAYGKKTRYKKLRKALQSKLYKHGIDPYIAEYNYEIVATQEERLRQFYLDKEGALCNRKQLTVYTFIVTCEPLQRIRINDSS